MTQVIAAAVSAALLLAVWQWTIWADDRARAARRRSAKLRARVGAWTEQA